MSSRSSIRSKDPNKYLQVGTWMVDPFWESDYYSEKTKQRYRKWLSNWIKNEHAIAAVDKTLK